jgi:putative PEP-CTERM system histidine kinase
VNLASLGTFGAIGYGLAALAFAVLTVLMFVSWRGRAARGAGLIVASAATACWATVLAFQSTRETFSTALIYLTEALQDTAWIGALIGITGATVNRTWKIGAAALCGVVWLALPVYVVLEQLGISYIEPMKLLSRAQLALCFAGLVLIEQLYRNSTHAGREGIRHFAIGLGSIFVYDMFLYSQAELFSSLSLEAWSARGLIVALAAPFIAISAQRSRDWSLDVFVSRQVVFYSATFFVVGAYLFLMALGGYYVRHFGGNWGRVGQLAFFAGAAVALVGLLASGSLRRHAAVFLSKHFYRNKYDYRVEWLRFIQTLSSSEEQDIRRTAIQAIAQIFSSPGGVLFLRREDDNAFVPAAAWPMRVETFPNLGNVAPGDDLAQFLERTRWIIDLKELRSFPDMYGNIVLPDWLLSIADLRIISPLLQREDVVGFLCLFEPPPPFKPTYEDRDLLKTVGRHVAIQIAQDDASRKLAESRQFEAYNRLTAFMMHDLKNSVAQLKLIVENYARHKDNPEFIEDAIATIGNAADRMSKLIEQLRSRDAMDRLVITDIVQLAREAAGRCRNRLPHPVVHASGVAPIRANPERMTAVIEHIIRNAQDATDETGAITLEVSSTEDTVVLSVTDTGAGMDPGFVRDRLFRPFDSTKGSKGMGIGAYQAREYVRSLGGKVEVRSAPQCGTTFSFTLPRARTSEAERSPIASELTE